MGVETKLEGYAPPMQTYAFPLTYQTSWQSTSTIHSPLLPSIYTATATVVGSVDGYGTLITPTSTKKKGSASPMASNDALRINTKTTQAYSYMGYGQSTTTYSFAWITKSGYGASISADSLQKPLGATYSTGSGNNSVGEDYSSPEDLLNLRLSANPVSNTETKLFYTMKNEGNSQVSIMDALGREVHILQNGPAQSGQNIIPIDPTKLSAGTYFLRVNAEGMTATRKLIITK